MIRIVCASPDIYLEDFNSDDYIIAVDKGLDYLLEKGIKPDVVIGDFDSTSNDEYLNYNYQKYPSEKDQTDLELALDLVKDEKDIYVYGALGGRIDHLMVNLRLVREGVTLIDKYNKIYLISGDTYFLKNDKYKYISFINLHEKTKISLRGFKYNLDDYTLTSNDTLCVSNEIVDKKAYCLVDRPIIVIESR